MLPCLSSADDGYTAVFPALPCMTTGSSAWTRRSRCDERSSPSLLSVWAPVLPHTAAFNWSPGSCKFSRCDALQTEKRNSTFFDRLQNLRLQCGGRSSQRWSSSPCLAATWRSSSTLVPLLSALRRYEHHWLGMVRFFLCSGAEGTSEHLERGRLVAAAACTLDGGGQGSSKATYVPREDPRSCVRVAGQAASDQDRPVCSESWC